MTTPTQPTFFEDIDTISFVANSITTNLLAVDSISISRSETILRTSTNNALRAVAWHVTGVDDTVTITVPDGNVLIALLPLAGYPGVLTFNWRPFAHNAISGSQLAEQLCTITGLVIDKKSLTQASKTKGQASFSGFTVEPSSDGTDPIVFTAASSPPADTQN